MLVRGVVDHQVHHDPDAPLMGLGQQGVKVLHGAEPGVDGPVVGDVVAVVIHGGIHDGAQPQHIDPQVLQIVQPGADAVQVPDAVPVRKLLG